MYISFYRTCLLLVGFIFSLTVHAAGLGKLTINSSLGQPLNAEIDLVSVNEEELSSLKTAFASREAFAQAGIRFEPFFPTFKFSIESRVNGDSYVKITSPQAVNEPFLNLLVELSWASGRLLREYTVLLDPADTWVPETVAPVVPSIQDSTETFVEAETVPIEREPQTTAAPAVEERQPQPEPSSPVLYTADTYGPIIEGDTLSSIARQVKPDSVNLNQMLVALFRANRGAFIADNMNLLRTGVVLQIPVIQDLMEISEKEANAEVRVQVNDWHEYRQKLASSTQQLQDVDTLSQTDAGEITTAVDNAAITRSAPPEEVLRLSSGEASSDLQNSSGLNAQERISMMEEDAIARDLALQEANERVAMLEKNIENLQRLLSLQSPELAQAQINAETQLQSQQPEAEMLEVIPSEPESGLVASSEDALEDDVLEWDETSETDSTSLSMDFEDEFETEAFETETIAALTPSEVPVEPVSNPVLLPESEEASLLDELMANTTYIIGGVSTILLLTLGAVMFKRRRAAAAAELEAEELRREELASALRDKTAAAVSVAHEDENQTDDSNEFDQADDAFSQTEASQEAEDDIELDLSVDDADGQAEVAEDETLDSDQPIELDFSTENEQAENELESVSNESDASMDMDAFDENQPEVAGAPQETDLAIDFEADSEPDVEETAEAGTNEVAETVGTDDEHVMDFTSEEASSPVEEGSGEENINEAEDAALQEGVVISEAESEPVESEPEPDANDGLDFSLDDSAIDLSDENQELDAATEEVSLDNDMSGLELPEMDLSDESLESDTPSDEQGTGSEENVPEIDFSDIDLDIENAAPETTENSVEQVAESTVETEIESEPELESEPNIELAESAEPAESKSEEKSEQWHEIETKIDLAKAYLEMEDMEGAREMLEEVAQEGDENQKNTAQEILEKL